MIDPFKEAERLKKIVCDGKKRKYYRFRASLFYGGIASADCVGCFLDCAYCWSEAPRKFPEKIGKFYSPCQVAQNLIKIAKKHHYFKVRISGNEPTLSKDHLLEVISLIPENFLFILETNGILIDREFAKKLSRFKNLHVRVSLKGANEKMFSLVTSALPEFFNFQLLALENLMAFNVSCRPAIMIDLYDQKDLEEIKRKLNSIDPSLVENLEEERLIFYPFVKERLKKRGIKIKRSFL